MGSIFDAFMALNGSDVADALVIGKWVRGRSLTMLTHKKIILLTPYLIGEGIPLLG